MDAVSCADSFVETMRLHGVERVFCVPGESYLPLLDSLGRSSIQVVTCRHEGGAALMAVAQSKLTGQAAVCMVSRGPGASNAAIGLHLAEQDAAPLVLVVGDVSLADIGRNAFQEVNYETGLGGFAKWTHRVTHSDTLVESLARAVRIAECAPRGPVILVIPEDILEGAGTQVMARQPATVFGKADSAQLRETTDMLKQAVRPILIAGSRLQSPAGRSALRDAADCWGLPVVTTFKQQDLIPNDHANYAGHLGFKIPQAILDLYLEADLVIAVGTRLGDTTTQGYLFPSGRDGRQDLVHVTDDAGAIGRVIPAALGIAADPVRFLEDLSRAGGEPRSEVFRDWTARLHEQTRPRPWPSDGDSLQVGAVVNRLSESLARDAVITTDSGNFSVWFHRHFSFRDEQRLIGAVGGAMGLGIPAAIAASLEWPERQVVALVGDGGFLMTGAELATAIAYGAKPKVIVCNNRKYGTIRMHQERAFPGRPVATDLCNPDFAMLARSHGIFAQTVRSLGEVDKAVDLMLSHDGPALIDLLTDPAVVSPGVRI
jgi:acetolactate synthase I/II/III large subunit